MFSHSGTVSCQDSVAPWWKNAVVYQIYPRSFQDSNGDGIGDIPGITARLDYLSELGVDAIWLSPFYSSPQADNGYDVADYQSVDPIFGSISDFDRLVREAHSRNIRVIIDMVINHTSSEHHWFLDSRSSVQSQKRDWYWWRPPKPGFVGGEPGAEPNNWGSFFSGSAWSWDAKTGEYYLSLFGAQQPDLNWENPLVRAELFQMMRWWLERGVDGFRMDVINLVSKPDDFPDGLVEGNGPFGDGFPHYSFGPRLHEFMHELRSQVIGGRDDIVIIGETPGATPAQAVLLTDPTRAELDMVFQFEHVELDYGFSKFDPVPLKAGALAESLTKWQELVSPDGWNSLYLENHDQPRSISRYGDVESARYASATALATAYQLLSGTPFIYQGQELGMANCGFRELSQLRDIESRRYFREQVDSGMDPNWVMTGLSANGRDNARTPMQWDNSETAGFSTGDPWLSLNSDQSSVNAVGQVADPGSVFSYYRCLIRLRHESKAIASGDFVRIDTGDPHIFAYERSCAGTGERVLVIVNLSGATRTISWPRGMEEEWQGLSETLSNAPHKNVGLALEVSPWQASVLRIEP